MKQEVIIDDFFDPQGALAKTVDDYHIRTEQIEMAKLVQNAIESNESLIVEAGTGVGKTFAYLVPAIINGGKVLISTATKNLQDQLYFDDIPKIRDALGVPVDINILKGRANYICQLRMEDSLLQGQFFNKEDAKYIHEIKKFSDNSVSGEISELKIPEKATIWPLVTSTKDNCLGQNCEFYKSCFIVKARKKALDSEIVIVNHHLFFADFVLKDEELSEILPTANTVIFDEAHQLPDTASIFFGQSISSTQITSLLQDSNQAFVKFPKTFKLLIDLTKSIQNIIEELIEIPGIKNNKFDIKSIENFDVFLKKFNNLIELISSLNLLFSKHNDQGPEFEKFTERVNDISLKLSSWINCEQQEHIYWVESFSKSIQFNSTPISVAEYFTKFKKENNSSWIFTSATLAVRESFDHFQSLMGLEKTKTKLLLSPFDYNKNACLYVPEDMPSPSDSLYSLTLVKKVLPLIRSAEGRAFILSTSIRAMEEIRSLLLDEFEKEGISYPILVQGRGSKKLLLDQFKNHGNAVLIGSVSFWEGVDVRGSSLSLVIIDKLPFQSPGDPVFASKIKMLNEKGENAFMTMQLPQAIIRLKQGAGRLIRDEFDKGVLMICDPRIVEKSYGSKIWRSLPAFKRIRDEKKAIQFLKNLD
jgi:ATP-dependent DNA helicase DinG